MEERVYRLPKWGLYVQLGGMILLVVVLSFNILPDAMKEHELIFVYLAMLAIVILLSRYLLRYWLLEIKVIDNDKIEFFTATRTVALQVTDLHSYSCTRGVWLKTAHGSFLSSSDPFNNDLYAFIDTMKKINPQFTQKVGFLKW